MSILVLSKQWACLLVLVGGAATQSVQNGFVQQVCKKNCNLHTELGWRNLTLDAECFFASVHGLCLRGKISKEAYAQKKIFVALWC